MKGIKHIFDPIYRQNYWYICTPTHAEFRKIVLKAGIKIEEKHNTDGGMYVYEQTKGQVIVLWTKNKTADLLAHEIMHAVSYCLRRKGLPLTDDSEEAYCYLFQYLMKEIKEK